MTHPNFEGMLECSFCESLTLDLWVKTYPKTGTVVYCEKCWRELSIGDACG